ncbi:MAG TPA: transglycosylase SLT domain-containing protein [Burkholderiales bacterium]|nr:transglycosylase SLT domain-containing protein [Burkholderiales bacterium]
MSIILKGFAALLLTLGIAAPVWSNDLPGDAPAATEHVIPGPDGQVPGAAGIVDSRSAEPGDAEPESTPVAAGGAPVHGVPGDLWERIRNGFAMTDFDNRAVRVAEAWYAARPDYMARMVERSRRYLFHVVEEVEKRGMPTEIALLPMIESAYNPMALSPAQALGMWQFIPSTGRTYGLRQDWWYDGRRDVLAATDAALDYLQFLYGMFNDWELSLAAYNWGEGAVARALLRNQAKGLPIDYHSLRVPDETRGYVPKLQAVKNIIRDPAAYGLHLESVPNSPYFETVTTSRPMDVKVAASLAEITVEEFVALNPGHRRPVIAAEEPQTLLLPVEKVTTFFSNLEDHDKPLVTWKIHHLRPGESLDRVAARYGISAARLKEVNGLNRGKVLSVRSLLVPARSEAEEPDIDTAEFIAPEVKAPKAKVARKPAKGGKTTAAKKSPPRASAAAKPVKVADSRRRLK